MLIVLGDVVGMLMGVVVEVLVGASPESHPCMLFIMGLRCGLMVCMVRSEGMFRGSVVGVMGLLGW